MINREQLKRSLPHGAIKEIADKLGVSYATVSRFLNGHCDNDKIEVAILEYLVEIEKKKRELYQTLSNL